MRLLLVEDSVALADELMPQLKREGYACDWLVDGRDALSAPDVDDYDIAILDLGLPGVGGMEVLAAWRRSGHVFPVLVLTARDRWTDRIAGLDAGADDYLSKPFHPRELVLRLRSLLRRSHTSTAGAELTACGVTLNEASQAVRATDGDIALTAAEFRLLRCFMLNPGRLFSRSQLAEHVYDHASERQSNVVEVHVSKLREKLGHNVILTRRGQGYCFVGNNA